MSELSFKLFPLAKRQSLYHLYTDKYGPTAFNESGAAYRFSPIELENGKYLPTYYAAIHCIDAMAETIIRRYRQKPTLTWHLPDETTKDVEKQNAKAIAQVAPNRDLELIDLETLRDCDGQSPIERELKLGNSAYAKLRNTAKFIYDNYEGYDGITWYGYQMRNPGFRCMMFFGDAVNESDLDTHWSGLMRETQNLHRLHDALRATNCEVPTWLKNAIDQ